MLLYELYAATTLPLQVVVFPYVVRSSPSLHLHHRRLYMFIDTRHTLGVLQDVGVLRILLQGPLPQRQDRQPYIHRLDWRPRFIHHNVVASVSISSPPTWCTHQALWLWVMHLVGLQPLASSLVWLSRPLPLWLEWGVRVSIDMVDQHHL